MEMFTLIMASILASKTKVTMMKKYTILPCLMALTLSIASHAKAQADEEDLTTFSETNYCQGCDISNATITKSHDNGSLINSFAIRAKFHASLYRMDFSGSIMTYCEIQEGYSILKAQQSNFDKANLSYSYMHKVDLSKANFTDVNLSESDFKYVNFSEADFTNANLQGATIQNSILIGSNLTEEQISQLKSIECTVMPDGTYNRNKC